MSSQPVLPLISPDRALPKPAVALAFSEPWRVSRAGALVTDMPGARLGDIRDRAYYGGNLVAESMSRPHAERAADCVNFCAGVAFQRGGPWVGGLSDLLDAFEDLLRVHGEPDQLAESLGEREAYRRWSIAADLLAACGRGPLWRRI